MSNVIDTYCLKLYHTEHERLHAISYLLYFFKKNEVTFRENGHFMRFESKK